MHTYAHGDTHTSTQSDTHRYKDICIYIYIMHYSKFREYNSPHEYNVVRQVGYIHVRAILS